MTAKPSSSDLLAMAGQAALGKVNVALPASVLSYDRDTQKAVVQVAVCYRVRDADGTESQRCRPPAANVPVLWLGVSWDLEAGDTGLVVVCDRAINVWKSTGNSATEPADPRRFDISDAVFLPGLRSFADPLPAEAVEEGAVVLWDRGTGDLRLGSAAATDPVALSSLVAGELAAIAAAITTLNGGTPLYVPGSVAASKVKAE